MANIMQKIQNGDIEGVKNMIRMNPTIIHKRDEVGRTPLMLACIYGANRRMIEILIEAGGEVGAKALNGRTALHWAVNCCRLEAVELLLSRGSEVNGKSKDGWTPLHFAAISSPEWTDGVRALLQHSSVEVNPRDVDGQTPLHRACSRGHLHTVDMLLGHNGIDATVVNNDGDTPLHVAVRGRKYKVVCLMLNQCCTALNLKIKERLSGVVVARYLASQGADFHHKNNNNNTPLDLIKDPNLRKKLEAFLPPQCRYCHENMATVRLQPCGDLVLCENCSSEMTFKRCPVCREYTLSKREFESPKSEDKCVQTEVASEEIGFQKLDERYLLKLACQLGGNWWKVGIFLGIKSIQLGIIRHDFSGNVQEQSFQMLLYWSTHCDPQEVTVDTLRAALVKAECLTALECLSLLEE
ncbi:E3 ubiquitin-protein ligase MIB2-like isoform X1 [Octopus vulgaris]|uniref:E3 ubiquitin-protein ligase MIB2-like isoform X1 n=1 Tax=Octopus vulgaris TaxID=6645 RepID=A0AA36AR27_OCTVU|nr:E3 ubiquitin-protein ligase MIB2-like isoform X1 [Octopus vulgaris]